MSNGNNDFKITPFSEVSEFHGHVCPGSAIGYKSAEIAIKELSTKRGVDEELVCISENDTCAVDAIQVLTGCTFGKGNLIFHDYGKQSYTFINRETGDAVRIWMKESFSVDNIDPNLSKLRENVNSGIASASEIADLKKIIDEVSNKIINLPAGKIFNVEHIKTEIPSKATIFKSVKCEKCGEMVSMHRAKNKNDHYFCIPCYQTERV